MSQISEIEPGSFEEFVKANKLAVVDFWAGWCMPCRLLSPIIEELSLEFRGKISFGKIDVDNPKGRELAISYGIRAVPTLLVFREGRLVDRIVGLTSKENLKRRLEKHLKA